MHAAEVLKEIIDGKGIKYTYIASKTGISVNNISRSLSGKRRLPADEMVKICVAVGIDLNEMVNSARSRDDESVTIAPRPDSA